MKTSKPKYRKKTYQDKVRARRRALSIDPKDLTTRWMSYDGYWMVGYVVEHRLIYERFWGPLEPGQVVHHIDGVKENNALSNLIDLPAWVHNALHVEMLNAGLVYSRKEVESFRDRALADPEHYKNLKYKSNAKFKRKVGSNATIDKSTLYVKEVPISLESVLVYLMHAPAWELERIQDQLIVLSGADLVNYEGPDWVSQEYRTPIPVRSTTVSNYLRRLELAEQYDRDPIAAKKLEEDTE